MSLKELSRAPGYHDLIKQGEMIVSVEQRPAPGPAPAPPPPRLTHVHMRGKQTESGKVVKDMVRHYHPPYVFVFPLTAVVVSNFIHWIYKGGMNSTACLVIIC